MSASNGVLVFLFLRAWWRPLEDRPRVVMRMRAERLAREREAREQTRRDGA